MLVALVGLLSARWTVALGGDIMLEGVPVRVSPFQGVETRLRGADLAFANLESPLTAIGSPTPRKTRTQLQSRSQFLLRGSPGQVQWIKSAGIDAVSLGNNHAMDYGVAALTAEIARLDQAGIHHAGAGKDKSAAAAVTVLTLRSGIRVGLVSALAFVTTQALAECTPATASRAGVNALAFGGRPTVVKLGGWIRAAHRRCDLLIVALHGGIERQTFPTAYQVELAHACIDAGADVVWGHHPHVLQGAELYRGHPILYSMGNLVSPLPSTGGIVTLRFDGETFLAAGFAATRITFGRVSLLKGRAALAGRDAFRRLCGRTAAKVHGTALPIR